MNKKNLIIIPFNLPWDWSADYQRQTCLTLHKNNLVIAYMHAHAHFILKRENYKYPKINNIIFISPKYIIPFRRFQFIEKLNQLITILFISYYYGKNKNEILLWIFDPLFYFYPFIKRLNNRIISLYDCVDYHWSRNLEENYRIRINEKKLILSTTYFIVNSCTLYLCHEKLRKPSYIVPLGFDRTNLVRNNSYSSAILPHTKPIICYIGAIDYRIDYLLLLHVIKKSPKLNFLFIGHIQTNDMDIISKKQIKILFTYKNVYHFEKIERKFIRNILKQTDIGIIPYNIKYDLNKYCFPMKTFEYFYFGKPIISTPILELRKFPSFIKIAAKPVDWQIALKELLENKWPRKYRLQQKKIALKNSWNKKIRVIEKLIFQNKGRYSFLNLKNYECSHYFTRIST